MAVLMHLSPTLLDKFQAWQESESSWDEYYGQADSPAYSMAEWDEKLEKDLIDACNGVQQPSSRPADLGTCLNEALDCVLLKQASTRDDVKLSSKDGAITAVKEPYTFLFHTEDIINLKSHVLGCTPQILVSANIETCYGTVQLYGYPDYFKSDEVIDLKSTSRYEGGKFRDKWQRFIYPYILDKLGLINDYKQFTFLVCKCSGVTQANPFVEMQLYNETYTDPLASFEDRIRGQVERFIEWFNEYHSKGIINDRLMGERNSKK